MTGMSSTRTRPLRFTEREAVRRAAEVDPGTEQQTYRELRAQRHEEARREVAEHGQGQSQDEMRGAPGPRGDEEHLAKLQAERAEQRVLRDRTEAAVDAARRARREQKARRGMPVPLPDAPPPEGAP